MILNKALDLIFPPFCVSCHKTGNFLCQECYKKLEFFTQPYALPQKPPSIEQIHILGRHQTPLNQLIIAYKYQHIKAIGQYLANMIFRHMVIPRVDLLTYVPVSKKRLKQRGFNQSQIIADKLALLANIPCIKLINKIKHSSHQASLNFAQRQKNLEQCFVPHPNLNNISSKIKSILIIDDVITTGATLNHCAQITNLNKNIKLIALVLSHKN